MPNPTSDIRAAVEELTSSAGHTPTLQELAAHLQLQGPAPARVRRAYADAVARRALTEITDPVALTFGPARHAAAVAAARARGTSTIAADAKLSERHRAVAVAATRFWAALAR